MKNVAGFLPHFRKTQKIFTTSNQKSDPHKNRLTTCIKDKRTSNRQITKIGTLLSLCRQSNKSRHGPAANATSNRIRKSARRHAAADPKRFSGDGSAPPRLSFVAPLAAHTCAWLRRASARRTCLCQAHAVVPNLLKQLKIGLRRFAEVRIRLTNNLCFWL